ncbi:unnamed protein product [Arctia plantaginis]|uniref:Uncharacterized protein n=1 Tax=Arctia plantaginis TaxID=874455 RepID=A0A8S1AWC3_ARCPL|nr:unnamed protein product [Arctia plantaginis]
MNQQQKILIHYQRQLQRFLKTIKDSNDVLMRTQALRKRQKLTCFTATDDKSLTGQIGHKNANSHQEIQLNIDLTSELENYNNFVDPNSAELVVEPLMQIVITSDAKSQTEEDTEIKQLKKCIECLEKKFESVAFDVDS